MKNLRLMFAALITVAFLGGLLGFKAARFSGFYIYKCNLTTQLCPRLSGLYDADALGVKLTQVYTSVISTLNLNCNLCTGTTTVVAE
jgi:hypothetical protein